MFDVFYSKANELNAKGQPFAMAIVVRHEAPISGKPGDKAIIQEDGSIWGWIGGGCTQPVIVKEAKKALKEGKPRMVRITPDAHAAENGLIEYNMTCHSGGTLEIYIEPVMPKPHLVIIGKSVVAQTLAKLGKVLNYHVTAVAPGADDMLFPTADMVHTKIDLSPLHPTAQTYIIVSTQGHHDETALEAALQLDVPYIAFVASRKKAQKVFEYLKEQDIPEDQVQRIKAPAGLDIKARLPKEIAVSILAEIIAISRGAEAPAKIEPPRRGDPSGRPVPESQPLIPDPSPQEAIDPVCDMAIDIATAKFTLDYEETTYYFCCPGCRHAFKKNPEQFLLPEEA